MARTKYNSVLQNMVRRHLEVNELDFEHQNSRYSSQCNTRNTVKHTVEYVLKAHRRNTKLLVSLKKLKIRSYL